MIQCKSKILDYYVITEITFDLKRNIENLIHMCYNISNLKINVNLLESNYNIFRGIIYW